MELVGTLTPEAVMSSSSSSRQRAGLPLLLGAALALLSAGCGDAVTDPGDEVAALAIVNFPEAARLGMPLTTLPIVELRDKHGRAIPTTGITKIGLRAESRSSRKVSTPPNMTN